ncbi:MotE family protein [Pararhizobium sp.]|uniref:MotE family protein n=1 Tax=Pararhizobium sp. TaxID=1977563 RepID=UPI0027244074|nr:MotE family protein [Pararhizobium sp.]MDO9416060.1 MotE family protein [Pararhizobium sp.]
MMKIAPVSLSIRKLTLTIAGVAMLAIPGAFAEETAAVPVAGPADEVQQFCTNIADAARDQRYLLQKKELQELQAGIDERIATLEKRRNEYEDWLKRRDDFLVRAEAGLVEIYKKMPIDAAARQMEVINPEVAAAIVMKLNPRASSGILGEMDAEKAAVLTNIISMASDPKTSKDPS